MIYADGEDADWKTNPTSYQIKDREVTAADTLSVVMAKGGRSEERRVGKDCRSRRSPYN